jgi:hypothetical protein
VATSVAEEILAEPLEARVEFLASDRKLHGHLTSITGTPWFIWQDSPVEFAEHVLRETIWTAQGETLQALWDHERVAVVASHGTGKTHIAARAVAWWIATRPFGAAQAVTTAPTWRQVKNLLWPHIRRLQQAHKLPGRIGENAEWKINGEAIAYGFSPNDSDEAAGQGIHAPWVLVVLDEAGGIRRPRFQALEGVMSSGFSRMLAVGNAPTDDEDSAFEEKWKSPSWHGMRISAWDTPNFTGEETGPCTCIVAKFKPHPVSDHLTKPEWVDEVRADFGEDSAYWIARVNAQFPRGVAQRTIPWSFIEAAQERESPEIDGDVASLGVDIASDGGDELAFAVAKGFDVTFLEGRSGEANADPLQVALRIRQHIEGGADVGWEGLIAAQRILNPNRRATVKIDVIGIGWGVHGIVKAWASEFIWPIDVIGVNVGEKPNTSTGQAKYLNKRAEMWWGGRELFREVVKLHCDKRTAAQLAGPKYDPTSAGLIKIESKDNMKARGLPSPDRAEAVLLAIYLDSNAQPAVTSGRQVAQTILPGVRKRGPIGGSGR